MRTALSIAGSDPSGGAGVQADIKVFAAFGVYGTTAITAVTVQNTLGVQRVDPLSASIVAEQIEAIVSDLGADAVKIGMLATAPIAEAVADAITRFHLPHVVLDPVLASSSGTALLDPGGVEVLVRRLLPLAAVVTPNAIEAERLTGIPVRDMSGQRSAASRLVAMGARAALVKGGHIGSPGPVIDVLYDGHSWLQLDADRIDTSSTHGTGCALSAAIAARLAIGDDLTLAARAAKSYVTNAIRQAPGLGHGRGPLGH